MKYLIFFFFTWILNGEEAFFRLQINRISSNKWHFVNLDNGRVLVPTKALEEFSIDPAAIKSYQDNTNHIDLKRFAKSIKIDEDNFQIDVELDLKFFQTTNISGDIFSRAMHSCVEGDGFYLNHNTTLNNTARGRQQLGSILEANALMPYGTIFNGLFVTINQDQQGFTAKRMDTFWSDDYGLQTLKVGDLQTYSPTLLSSTRLLGLQYGTRFNARPGFVTYYQPSIKGSAVTPTTIDIFANNVKLMREDVKTGQYNITNIPVISGDGTLIVETTDITGKKSTIEVPYFMSPSLLKEDLAEYYLEAGIRRENYLKNNFDYRYLAASLVYRYGLADFWTPGITTQTMSNLISTEFSNTVYIPYLGVVTGTNAFSKSPKGVGYAFGLNYSKSISDVTFGFDAKMTRKKFTDIGNWPDVLTPRISYTSFIGAPLGENGSASFSYLNNFESTGRRLQAFTASYRVLLEKGLVLSLTGSRTLSKEKNGKSNDTRIYLQLTYSFGGSKSVSLGYSRQKNSKSDLTSLDFNDNFSEGTYSGSLSRLGDGTRYSSRLTHATKIGDIDLRLDGLLKKGSDSNHWQALNLNGALGLVEDQYFVSRKINNSMALVSVSGLPNIRVYHENRLVGKTNEEGKLVIPDMSPFQMHKIRIDEKDLPLNYLTLVKEKTVIAPEYSAILVNFEITPFKPLSLTFKDQDGAYVPSGSTVRFDDVEKEKIVGFDGLVFINTYVKDIYKGTVTIGPRLCTFDSEAKEIRVTCPEEEKPVEEKKVGDPQKPTVSAQHMVKEVLKPTEMAKAGEVLRGALRPEEAGEEESVEEKKALAAMASLP